MQQRKERVSPRLMRRGWRDQIAWSTVLSKYSNESTPGQWWKGQGVAEGDASSFLRVRTMEKM